MTLRGDNRSVRWVLKEGDLRGDHDYIVGPPFEDGVEVMPVAEHEKLREALDLIAHTGPDARTCQQIARAALAGKGSR